MTAKTLSRLRLEVWKDIPEYEGLYQVSNLGNVKSLKFVKERILKAIMCGDGYFVVNLYKDGKKETKYIHQLAAIAFLDHTPNGVKLVVNHIDINRENNNLYNLEIITNRENCNQKHLKSSSEYIGVSWAKRNKKWQAQIYVNGKGKHLGFFTDEKEAAQVYQNELNKIKL